jgi:hypothetical protein
MSQQPVPFVQMGQASLFVYWVHVELAYGFLSQPLHNALPLGGAFVAFGLLTIFMWLLAGRWLRRRDQPWIPTTLRPEPQFSFEPLSPAVSAT